MNHTLKEFKFCCNNKKFELLGLQVSKWVDKIFGLVKTFHKPTLTNHENIDVKA